MATQTAPRREWAERLVCVVVSGLLPPGHTATHGAALYGTLPLSPAVRVVSITVQHTALPVPLPLSGSLEVDVAGTKRPAAAAKSWSLSACAHTPTLHGRPLLEAPH